MFLYFTFYNFNIQHLFYCNCMSRLKLPSRINRRIGLLSRNIFWSGYMSLPFLRAIDCVVADCVSLYEWMMNMRCVLIILFIKFVILNLNWFLLVLNTGFNKLRFSSWHLNFNRQFPVQPLLQGYSIIRPIENGWVR